MSNVRLQPRAACLVALLVLGTSACDGSSPGVNEPDKPRLETITISSAESRDSIRAGQTLQLTAAGQDQNGQPLTLNNVVWSSGNTAVAEVNASTGRITGVANGQAVIKASSGGKEGSFTVTVWCRMHTAGGITASETWTAAEDPHCVTGTIAVDGANTVLTIEAGSEVYFARDARLWVGANSGGSLRAVGTASAPIRMLADTAAPVAGFWQGVALNAASTGSELAHVTMSHCGGGSGDAACLTLSGAQPVVRTLSIENSGGYGVHAQYGGAFASGSTGLSVTGSAGFPLHIEANHAGSIPAVTAFSGNGRQAVQIRAGVNDGAVSRSQTWPTLQVPYVVAGGQLFVHGSGDAVTTLTLPAGTELRFEPDATLIVGTVSGAGAVVAQGTATSPVRLTADAASPAADDYWAGVTVYGAGSSATALTNVIIEFCGAGSAPPACLLANGEARPALTNVTVRNSAGYGIYMDSHAAFGAGSADVAVSNTAAPPVRIEANYVGSLPGGAFSGDSVNAIEVAIGPNGGVVTRSQTWPNPGIPYLLTGGQLFVNGNDAPVLTLTPGTELRMGSSAQIIVGHDSYGAGSLVARGTAEAPIRFTSSATAPAPGAWDAIHFYSRAGGSALHHVIVEYAGEGQAPWDGSIHIYSDELGAFIANSIVRNSASCGVWVERAVTTDYTGSGNVFSGNAAASQCRPQ